MRISDWSSDVCSSDLIGQLLVELDRKFVKGSRFREEIIRADDRRVAAGVAAADPAALDERDVGETMVQIGRASCRERVGSAGRSRWSPYHEKKNRRDEQHNNVQQTKETPVITN